MTSEEDPWNPHQRRDETPLDDEVDRDESEEDVEG